MKNGTKWLLFWWWVLILAVLVGNNLSRVAGGPSFDIGVYAKYLLVASILCSLLMAINGAEILAFLVSGALVVISSVSIIAYLAQLSTFDNIAMEIGLRILLIVAGLPNVLTAKKYL